MLINLRITLQGYIRFVAEREGERERERDMTTMLWLHSMHPIPFLIRAILISSHLLLEIAYLYTYHAL